jgi:Spy/CpxP family protein refolding chaperone
MSRIRIGGLVLVLVLMGTAFAQDKDKDKPKKPDEGTPTRLKGQLPPYFKKLGLRDDQVQKIYKLRADYKVKADDLKKKMDLLKGEEKESLEKVLTPEQLKRLKELRSGEKLSDS